MIQSKTVGKPFLRRESKFMKFSILIIADREYLQEINIFKPGRLDVILNQMSTPPGSNKITSKAFCTSQLYQPGFNLNTCNT